MNYRAPLLAASEILRARLHAARSLLAYDKFVAAVECDRKRFSQVAAEAIAAIAKARR